MVVYLLSGVSGNIITNNRIEILIGTQLILYRFYLMLIVLETGIMGGSNPAKHEILNQDKSIRENLMFVYLLNYMQTLQLKQVPGEKA